MRDEEKTKEQLLDELTQMRQRIAELEASEIKHRQIEQALRESEERYRSVVENSNAGILVVDDAFRLIYANDELGRILRHPREEIIGQDFRRFLDERSRELVVDRYVRRQRGDEPPPRYEFSIVRKGGEKRHVEISSTLIRDSAGNVRTVGQILDVTERKRAEEALKRSEERYALAQQAANIGSWDWDIRTGDLHWSDQIEPMFGFDRGEFGATYEAFLESVHPDDRQYVVDSVNACVEEGQEYAIEHRIAWPDGTVRWVSEVGDVFRDENGEAIRMLGIVQDITERKQAEEDLRVQGAALESAANGIVITDREGTILWANPAFTRLTGYAPEEALGQNPRLLKSGQQDSSFYRHMWNTILAGQVWHGEVVNRCKDSTLYTEEMTITPVRDEHGQITHFIAIKQDVTERRRAEEALRQYTADLEARNEELDAFAHTVAHDLKGPLSIVVGYADMLEEDDNTLSPEELQKYVHTIARNGRKMNKIIDELLLLSVVRQMEVELYALDMATIVAEAQQRLDSIIEEYQAEIILPETWPAALGYGPWIEEVWANYLSNALKYGGRPPRVELGATIQPDGRVRFWVRDNGPGLTPQEQSRLFTPFTRLDQMRAKGHGLGLSIVRRIVEKLGGQVGVESKVSHGSAFTFTLPGTVSP